MIKKFLKILILVLILAIILTLLIFPSTYSKACLDGILLWANYVLPSLFPFLFLTAIMTRLNFISKFSYKLSPLTKKLFALNGISSYCLFMSIISGYPVGSRVILDLKENNLITKNEATKMSPLCSTSGPIFVIGSVGANMFKSVSVGLIIFISHLLSVIICGIIFRFYKKEKVPSNSTFCPSIKADNIMGESVYSSIVSILTIGGFIALFYTFISMLTNWYILLPLGMFVCLLLKPFNCSALMGLAFVSGIIEATTGCSLLSSSPEILSYALAGFVITFGGISILSQQIFYLKKAEVSIKFFLLVKICQAIISFFICYLLFLLF